MEKILKKKYLRITFRLASPLRLGSGENKDTDNDILKDVAGVPYIPGSSLAGIYRNMFSDMDRTKYFGDILNNQNSSRVKVFDAYMSSDDYVISVRDSVALDEYKTGIAGNKFDAQVLEPGVEFITYVEQDFFNTEDIDCLNIISDAFINNSIFIGAKTMRGYGEISIVEIKYAEFDFNNVEDVKKWISFDMYGNEKYVSMEFDVITRKKQLVIRLNQRSGISIRRYTTEIDVSGKTSMPDYIQLYVKNGEEEIPVIPGTTWSGAFKHRIEEIAGKDRFKNVFGIAGGEENSVKSIIRFHESQIENAKSKIVSRNAIDRFTGGTADGALYTEKAVFNGSCNLVISFSNMMKTLSEKDRKDFMKLLSMAITDLHYGFMGIGGQTAIGRGLFEIVSINDEKIVDNDDVYTQVYNIVSILEV